MFERFTEKARRVIFFARYEASNYGNHHIETEHLLLGLLREDPALEKRLFGPAKGIEEIRTEIERRITKGERFAVSVEVPLSTESTKILNNAAEEAERLGHRHVGTEHLLLGMLRVDGSLAAEILRARGLKSAAIREQLAKATDPAKVRAPLPGHASSRLESFLSGLRWHSTDELTRFFAMNALFIDVHGKRWNREEIGKQFETLFAPYAKKNATYLIEETLVNTNELLVVIVLWKNAILASLERIWIHRMCIVLVPEGDDWAIVSAQVTPVQPT